MSRGILISLASITLLLCSAVIAVSLDGDLLQTVVAHVDISDTLMGGLLLALGAASLTLPA